METSREILLSAWGFCGCILGVDPEDFLVIRSHVSRAAIVSSDGGAETSWRQEERFGCQPGSGFCFILWLDHTSLL